MNFFIRSSEEFLNERVLFPARVCNTSQDKDKSVHPMLATTSNVRGRSLSRTDNDGREAKKYVFGLTPPRHTTGGLLSSWLVDQQNTFDGHRWALLCPPCPRRWASLMATPSTVLGPGMDQDSSACRSVNTSCRKAVPHREGVSRQSSTSYDND